MVAADDHGDPACAKKPIAHAQVLDDILTGDVTDRTGAAIAAVTVVGINEAHGEKHTVQTHANGDYILRNLEAGL